MPGSDVSVRDLQQTLLDIENWTAEVRELLEWLPPSTILTTRHGVVLPAVPEIDDAPLAEDAPAVVRRPFREGNIVLKQDGPIGPAICTPPAQTTCGVRPEAERAEVKACDLHRAMRGIEVLAGVCRVLMGQIDRNRVIRPCRDS